MSEFRPKLSERQSLAYWTLLEQDVNELLYGGAKGGGKSVFGCYWMYIEACELIKKHFMAAREHPVPIGFMGRKQSVDFNNTTLETWKMFIPPEGYRIKEQAKEIIIGERVKIDYGGLDRTEDIRKFNSAAYARIFIDQAEEITIDDAGMLRGTINRPVGGQMIAGKMLWTANPAQCWLKIEFIEALKKHQRFVPALPADNPWLPQIYMDQLKDAFEHRPELLEAYLHGSWDAAEEADQAIKSNWVTAALKKRPWEQYVSHKVITCDPARFGDAETVIYYLEDGTIKDQVIYGQKDTMHTVGRITHMAHEKGVATIVVDSIGIGAGIVDRLREMANTDTQTPIRHVIAINGAEKSTRPEKYLNVRAEVWDKVARKFSDGQVVLASDEIKKNVRDMLKLQHQLCTPRYQFKNGKLAIESKEQIIKRLGHSPDRADAYVMGLSVTDTAVHAMTARRTTSRAEDEKAGDYDIFGV